jgi:hypothetical protein
MEKKNHTPTLSQDAVFTFSPSASQGRLIWGGLQDVFRNPTDEFKEEVLTFNTFLETCDFNIRVILAARSTGI